MGGKSGLSKPYRRACLSNANARNDQGDIWRLESPSFVGFRSILV